MHYDIVYNHRIKVTVKSRTRSAMARLSLVPRHFSHVRERSLGMRLGWTVHELESAMAGYSIIP